MPGSYFRTMAEELISRADVALYQAKAAGKDRLVVGEATPWRVPEATVGDNRTQAAGSEEAE